MELILRWPRILIKLCHFLYGVHAYIGVHSIPSIIEGTINRLHWLKLGVDLGVECLEKHLLLK